MCISCYLSENSGSVKLTFNILILDKKEKINLNFYFHTDLWCLKRFYEGL